MCVTSVLSRGGCLLSVFCPGEACFCGHGCHRSLAAAWNIRRCQTFGLWGEAHHQDGYATILADTPRHIASVTWRLRMDKLH